MKSTKRAPGKPRVHKVGQWSSVHFRLPLLLREELFQVLETRNSELPYRLSLNSLLLELIEAGLQAQPAQEETEEKVIK